MKAPLHLYTLEDGTYADPKDCSKKDGVLKHKNGMAVALKEDGSPFTLGDASKHNAAAAQGEEAKVLTTEDVEADG